MVSEVRVVLFFFQSFYSEDELFDEAVDLLDRSEVNSGANVVIANVYYFMLWDI